MAVKKLFGIVNLHVRDINTKSLPNKMVEQVERMEDQ
jgi:hypothetical protein